MLTGNVGRLAVQSLCIGAAFSRNEPVRARERAIKARVLCNDLGACFETGVILGLTL